VLGGISVLEDIVLDAKEQGYYVVVADYLQNSPAKKIANESWLLSIDNVDAIVQKCREEQIDGVMNYCLDPGQKPYQQICEKLGLPCVATFKQFEIMTNKDVFAKTCAEYELETIPSYTTADADSMLFPVMIKPVDSRASKGLVVCNTRQDLPSACEYARSFSKRKQIRIEKYLRGKPEICAKYFVADGEVFFTSMADVFTCSLNDGRRVYLGTQTYPSKYYEEYMESTHSKVVKMIKGIGIQNGALSFTGFHDEGVFRFFDPSLRMGGAQDWKIVKAISGVDISKLLTNFAMTGKMGEIQQIRKIDRAFIHRYSALLYFDVIPGIIGKIQGVEEALEVPGVYGYHQCHQVGDEVKSLGTTDNVALRFIVSCESRNDFVHTVHAVQDKIQITDAEGENQIAPMFDPEVIRKCVIMS
jgi:biotin carboxylase